MSAAMLRIAAVSVHGLAGSALKFCVNATPSDCRAASTGVMPNTHARNTHTVIFSSSIIRRKNCKLCAIPSPLLPAVHVVAVYVVPGHQCYRNRDFLFVVLTV